MFVFALQSLAGFIAGIETITSILQEVQQGSDA
jgi:hypothetical protein